MNLSPALQLNELRCFPVIIEVMCNATADQAAQIQMLVPVLLGAAERCSNYQAPPFITCPDGKIITTANMGRMGAGAPAAEPPMPEMGAALPGAAAGGASTPSAGAPMPDAGATLTGAAASSANGTDGAAAGPAPAPAATGA